MLETINGPQDLKNLDTKQLDELAQDIRKLILNTVSENGGHLSSNLGMVEATIALHKAFDSPNDKIIFDVGHQCYAHKILTGRKDSFSTLRTYGGISGFTNRNESEHDIFFEGHAGTSLSSALGIAEANKINGIDNYTVAVVGDASFSNGEFTEAVNNCNHKDLKLIIVLNDNDMSISKNTGSLHNYFSKIRASKKYIKFKRSLEYHLSKIPGIGKGIAKFFKIIKDFFKRIFVKPTLFESLGLDYIGPVNGHSISDVSKALEAAKIHENVCLVHIITKKGKGYSFAEEKPDKFHSISRFDLETGNTIESTSNFSEEFGKHLCEIAQANDKVCAITAAMCDGTGLTAFKEKYPDRFFDVGISEEHAITFASGMSSSGCVPVLAIYSTFIQRGVDQIIHDVSIQNMPLVLVLDRAGLVPNDGITHQGIFDFSLLSAIPRLNIYSPEKYSEMNKLLDRSVQEKSISVIRIPKGSENEYQHFLDTEYTDDLSMEYTVNSESANVVILTYGRLSAVAHGAAELLVGECNTGVVKLVQINPINYGKLAELTKNADLIYVLEEGIRAGGVGEKIAYNFCNSEKKVLVHSIDNYVEHGKLDDIMKECKFTKENVSSNIKKALRGVKKRK